MALTFEQLATLASDPVVRGRVRVAATRVAVPITRELASDVGGDARWSKRQALARKALDLHLDPSALDLFVWGVIGAIDTNANAPTDAQLQALVSDVWDELAGVTGPDLSPQNP